MIKKSLYELKEDKEDELKSKLSFFAAKIYFGKDKIVLKKKHK